MIKILQKNVLDLKISYEIFVIKVEGLQNGLSKISDTVLTY